MAITQERINRTSPLNETRTNKIINIINEYQVDNIAFQVENQEEAWQLLYYLEDVIYHDRPDYHWSVMHSHNNHWYTCVQKSMKNHNLNVGGGRILFSNTFEMQYEDFHSLMLDKEELKFLKKLLATPWIRKRMRKVCNKKELTHGIYAVRRMDIYERICTLLKQKGEGEIITLPESEDTEQN